MFHFVNCSPREKRSVYDFDCEEKNTLSKCAIRNESLLRRTLIVNWRLVEKTKLTFFCPIVKMDIAAVRLKWSV